MSGSIEPGDNFGNALAAGDFNSDGFADLAVGAFLDDGGSLDIFNAGAVNVLYGAAAGLTGSGSQFFTQNTPGVGSSAEVNELFGFALAAGDFDRDRHADLAIGVPGEDVVDPLDNAGAVNVLYGGAAGLTGSGSQFFTQNTPGVGGTAEDGDLFGLVTAGDFDRDRYPDLAIGVLQESVGSIGNAGAVNVLYGGRAGLTGSGGQYFTQNTPGVASSAEQFDGFGRALAAGDFDGDRHADLAIGVPEEDVGSINAAGAVNVLYGGRPGLAGSGSQFFTQNTRGWAAPPRTATVRLRAGCVRPQGRTAAHGPATPSTTPLSNLLRDQVTSH